MEKILFPKDVIAMGFGRSTVYQMFNRKDFPSFHVGKKLGIYESDLREWLTKGGTERHEARV